MTDPNSIEHFGSVKQSVEVQPSSSQLRSPKPTSHFYATSLPAQPIRTSGGQARSDLTRRSCAGASQDLDQITTFTEIMDSLKNYPADQDSKEINSFSRSKDMTYMAPLGPSQVDIGNLSCRLQTGGLVRRLTWSSVVGNT